MACMGKPVALQVLALDETRRSGLKAWFYMRIGRDGPVAHAIREISKIRVLSGVIALAGKAK